MKKSCILLFVMSIISLLLSLYAAISYIDSSIRYTHLSNIERTVDNGFGLDLAQVAVGVGMFFEIVIIVSSFILGIFGLISSIKKGRLSILCIILDSLPLAYIFCGVISFMMEKNDLYKDYMLVLLFLSLYMIGAVISFKGQKRTKEIS